MSVDWSWRARVPGVVPMIALRAAVEDVAKRLGMRITVADAEDFDEPRGQTHIVVTFGAGDGEEEVEHTILASQPDDDEDEDVFSLQISTSFGDTEEAWDELMSVGNALADWLQLESGDDESGDDRPKGSIELAKIRCKIQLSLEAKGTSVSRRSTFKTHVRGAFPGEGTAKDELVRIERRIALALGAGKPAPVDDATIFAWLEAQPDWRVTDDEDDNGERVFGVEPGGGEPMVWLFLVADAVEPRIWLESTAMDAEEALDANTTKLSHGRLGYSGDMYFIEAHLRRDMLTREILVEEILALLEEARALVAEHGDGDVPP